MSRTDRYLEVVVDTSLIVDWFEPGNDAQFDPSLTIHAPTLVDYEFQSTMRRKTLAGVVSSGAARAVLDAFAELEIRRHPAFRFSSRMWDMRDDITSYDASYVALAEALDLPLMTSDRRLAQVAARYCEVLTH